jgi:intracellular septation protein
MQNLLELAALAVFVVAYYLRGIYVATAALMAAMAVTLLIDLAVSRRIPARHGLSAALVFVFGAATLLLHDQRYIQWKPTVFFWLAAAAFLASLRIGRRPLAAMLLGKALDPDGRIPERVWRRLNGLWVVFYAALGALNLAVAYHASERAWVNFNIFGLTLLTAAFIFAQALWLSRLAASSPSAEIPAEDVGDRSTVSG